MFLVLSKLFGPLTDPLLILGVTVLVGALAALVRMRRLAVVLQIAAITIFVTLGLLPGANWLAAPLEDRFPANPLLPDRIAGIIALGGTERLAVSSGRNQPTISDPGPIAALIALGRRYPDATLVFSGGNNSRGSPGLTESDVVHSFLTELGINGDQIIYERQSRNTRENAVLSRNLILPKDDERWVLVTQAISMPRAVGVFRRAGWEVIPFPAGYMTTGDPPAAFSTGALHGFGLAAVALHEWVGLLAYRVMGYTGEVFPQ